MNAEVQASCYRVPNQGTLSYRKPASFETPVTHAVIRDTIKGTIRSYSQQMQSNSEKKITSRPSHWAQCKQKHDNC